MIGLAFGTVVVLVVGGFFLLAALLIGLAVFAARRRRDAMAGFAAAREWRFHETGPGLEDRFRGRPFGLGHARGARNVIEGRYEGRWFLAFDYLYTIGSGDDSNHHTYSVVSMSLEPHRTPMLEVMPQGWFGRLIGGLLGNDLQVGDPAFDDAFGVRTDSPAFARDVLHPGFTSQIMNLRDRAWRLQDDSLLLLRHGHHSPQEIEAVLGSAKMIIDAIPRHVWDRLDGTAR